MRKTILAPQTSAVLSYCKLSLGFVFKSNVALSRSYFQVSLLLLASEDILKYGSQLSVYWHYIYFP